MFFEIFKFEINFHRRQNLVYVLTGVLFLLFFAATTTPNVSIGPVGDNININSPYAIVMTLGAASLIALFGSVAFSANAVIRDYDHRTAEMFFSRPLGKAAYVYGRFFGTLIFGYIIFLGALLGILAGEFMPWLDAERLGEFSITPYLYGFFVIGLPNLFVFSALFFCIATVTRSMMWTYVGVITLLVLSFVLDTFTDRETIMLTSILDPFGATALEEVTRYWTAFEKNTLVPEISGGLLINRLFWLGLGVVFFASAYPLFSFDTERRSSSKKDNKIELESSSNAVVAAVANRPAVHPAYDLTAQFQQYLSQSRIEVRNIVTSVPFIAILLVGLLSVVGNATAGLGSIFGTPVYASTYTLVRIINGAFSLSLVVVLIYYAGELMVREKSVAMNEIMDVMPFPNWVMIAAKLTGLVTVILGMLLVAMLAGIGVQLFTGFYEIDIGLYLKGLLFFFQFPLYLMCVLAILCYVLTRNKYFAMLLMVIYFIMSLTLNALGFEHYLYRMRQLPPVYSDFTGYSQNLVPYLWQTFYWGLFGCLMLIVIHLFWPRGSEDTWRSRLQLVRTRLSKPVVVSAWAFSLAWVLTGGFIYYNTVILNPYITADDLEASQADYEKRYQQHEHKPMPVITGVYAEVDIFPADQEILLRGTYDMLNDTDAPQHEMHFSIPPMINPRVLSVPGATLTYNNEDLGYQIYTFETPVAPGETFTIRYEMDWLTPGFANNGHSRKLAHNGTFVNNADFFPLPGYQAGNELQDNNKRRDHDLPPIERQAKIDDESAWQRNGFSNNRVDFETIVSTSPEQIAIAPGYLQREWQEGERRYFHYKMDEPIWNFYSFMSADYDVARDTYNDVAIEVYHKHDYKLDTMIYSTKRSLEYFEANFSPYQYRQYRIMEFPSFQGRFAQAFPNTIPFSEDIGFRADLRDKTEIDYVFYVNAHELSHQWWAHQVMGANVQGQTMIIESLAQYSALMVMEAEYGPETMQKFLQFEMDRYLSGRGSEIIEELPLYLVENQPYIHYRKGSVVLYALKDYVGEDTVNAALRDFIADYAFKGAPFPTTNDLIARIRKHAGPEHDALIADLLQKIIVYDLKVANAAVTERQDGQFEVTLDVVAQKYEADGEGREVAVPLDAMIDIGVLGEKQGDMEVPEVLFIEKRRITESEQSFTIIVDKPPVSVGIDPLNKLIDRNPEDNVQEV